MQGAEILGNLQFNGAGFITGGSYVDYEVNGAGPLLQCGPINVLSGSTYSVDATGAMGVSLILSSTQPGACGGLLPSGMKGSVQQNGQGFAFVGTNGNFLLAGTGLKQ
jgi:hypothetical protein